MEQSTQKLNALSDQLRAGNFIGSGELRDGIVGDIENIFGWHGQFSPETPLTNQDRVTWLEKFREAAVVGAETTHAKRTPINWIDGRIEEIKETEVDKWMKARAQTSEPLNEPVRALLNRFKTTGNEYGEILARGIEDTHPMMIGRGKSYTPQDEARMRELFLERKNIKLSLYDALYKQK